MRQSNLVCTRHSNPMFQLEWHSLHMTHSTLGLSWRLLWGRVNPAECAHRITVRVRHFSFRSLVGKHRWERRPAVATSPRLSSISGSGQDIAGESKNRGAQLYRSKRRRGKMVFQVSGWGVFSELTKQSRGRGECLFIDIETILVVNMKHLLYFQGRSLPRSAKEKLLMLHPLGREWELIVTPNQFNQLESRTLNGEISAS